MEFNLLDYYQTSNGEWRELSYIVVDKNKEAILIDPGENFSKIMEIIETNNLTLKAILCTHGHYDHIASVRIFQEKFNIPFYLHKEDFLLLRQANFYRTLFSGKDKILIPAVDVDLSTCSNLIFGNIHVQVFQTPGHTKGGVSFLVEKILFSGDNLIEYKIGRSDLPGGDRIELLNTLKIILEMSDDITIFPGHGERMPLSIAKLRMKKYFL